MKSYVELTDQITADQLFEGFLAFGLFSEKIVPVFTGKYFYNYCINNNPNFSFPDKSGSGYVSYKNMRNINVPRELGIPNPMAYYNLCNCLKDNWENIKNHFRTYTINQNYKISRIHIRKKHGTKKLFSMSYNNWELDGEPEPALLLGKRYLVQADISNCFFSIYSHSLTWALATKEIAKCNRRGNWYNAIDEAVQKTKCGETHGLLIGPHASNLLSEIILVAVDKILFDKGYKFIRHIDDYSCYVESDEQAQDFLSDLSAALQEYDLQLNHKKTRILELPSAIIEKWKRQLNTSFVLKKGKYLDFYAIRAYLDSAIELMKSNDNNAAVLTYAIKSLRGQTLSKNAQKYAFQAFSQYAFIYPYLIPYLDAFVFKPYKIASSEIETVSNLLFNNGMKRKNYEATSYAVYFAIKYDFELDGFMASNAIQSKDCIFNVLAFKYFSKFKNTQAIKELKKYARSIQYTTEDYDRNWLFIYECLPESDLKGDWKVQKRNKVKFTTI